jgi:hypothetical protein
MMSENISITIKVLNFFTYYFYYYCFYFFLVTTLIAK